MSDIHPEAVVHHSSWVPVYLVSIVTYRKRRLKETTTYEFDGHLLIVQEICSLEDDTKRPFTDLLSHPIVDTHYVGR